MDQQPNTPGAVAPHERLDWLGCPAYDPVAAAALDYALVNEEGFYLALVTSPNR